MTIHIIVAARALFTTTGLFAADHTWTGAISDKMCGADHKKMGGKMSDRECTQACAKGGGPYVLIADGKVHQLTGMGQRAVPGSSGRESWAGAS